MKRFVYMLILILLAVLSSVVFSFFGVERFLFYTFFFYISAFVCGLKPMPLLFLFLITDGIVIKDSWWFYSFQIFVFVLVVCICFRRANVYIATIAGYVISLVVCIVLQLAIGENVLTVFDKFVLHSSCIFAIPFVFALMRAGIVNRKGVEVSAKKTFSKY